MYSDRRSRFEQLKERAGLGRVQNRVLIAVTVIVAALIGYAVWSWYAPSRGAQMEAELYGHASVEETSSSPSDPQIGTAEAEDEPQNQQRATVHVVGAVANPGVYELEGGARIGDAIEAAGGVGPDAEVRAVNFAAIVTDGMQIIVPTVEEAQSGMAPTPAASGAEQAQSGGRGASAGSSSVVNINTANADALTTLPGIGPATATKIIADREKNGPFKSPSDLQRVSGIGPKKYEALTGLIAVQ